MKIMINDNSPNVPKKIVIDKYLKFFLERYWNELKYVDSKWNKLFNIINDN